MILIENPNHKYVPTSKFVYGEGSNVYNSNEYEKLTQ